VTAPKIHIIVTKEKDRVPIRVDDAIRVESMVGGQSNSRRPNAAFPATRTASDAVGVAIPPMRDEARRKAENETTSIAYQTL